MGGFITDFSLNRKFRKYFKKKIKSVIIEYENQKEVVKPKKDYNVFFPVESEEDTYLIKKTKEDLKVCEQGLPIPPVELRMHYGNDDEVYLNAKGQIDTMLRILGESGSTLQEMSRVLDFGCGSGRMIRWLKPFAESCEIWGTDISSEHIYWANTYLNPPFNFATTTTIPHLPFEDKYFNLIYAGSVFTHIDDLAIAWLLELRRILAEDGMAYITIHDRHSIELLNRIPIWKKSWVTKSVNENTLYQKYKDEFGVFTIFRGPESQVFYDIDYFCNSIRNIFEVISITPEAYGYQTGVLLKKK